VQDGGSIPHVGVDREARAAGGGGLAASEAYETAERFAVDAASDGRFPFLADLATWLADRDRGGAVFVDGGHGGFGAVCALSVEDVADDRRSLEGRDVRLERRNRPSGPFLAGGRAPLVTTPVGPFGAGDLDRIRTFRDDGGGVVRLAGAGASAFARGSLSRVAGGLGWGEAASGGGSRGRGRPAGDGAAARRGVAPKEGTANRGTGAGAGGWLVSPRGGPPAARPR
jgi:hypothetical protein